MVAAALDGAPALVITRGAYGAIRNAEGRLPRPWLMPLLPRLMIHVYFVGAGILLGIFLQLPVLLAMSVGMLLIELSLAPATRRL